MENNRKGNEIFLGVIGVATLIVAIIGATFAYFSASANSATDAINVTSTTLSLGYKDDTTRLKTDLIPAYDNIALLGADSASENGECVDDNKNNICGIYTFSIGNPSATTAQKVYGRIEIMDDANADNDFTNLYFRIYEQNKNGSRGNQVVGPTNFATAAVKTGADNAQLYNGKKVIELTALDQLLSPSPKASVESGSFNKNDPSTYGDSDDGNNVKDYLMVVWLRETETPQNTSDGAKSLTAGIVFTTEGGTNGGVTGVIGVTVGANEED